MSCDKILHDPWSSLAALGFLRQAVIVKSREGPGNEIVNILTEEIHQRAKESKRELVGACVSSVPKSSKQIAEADVLGA